MVRDSLAIALQQGQDPDERRPDQGVPPATSAASPSRAPADVIAAGDSGPRPDDFRAEVELVLDFIQRVWNDRDLEKVDDFMRPRPGAADHRLPDRSSGPRATAASC